MKNSIYDYFYYYFFIAAFKSCVRKLQTKRKKSVQQKLSFITHRLCVFRITGNHLEVQLVILELQQEDSWTELKCICQNQDQKQEVVTQIKLEGEHPLVRGLLYASLF